MDKFSCKWKELASFPLTDCMTFDRTRKINYEVKGRNRELRAAKSKDGARSHLLRSQVYENHRVFFLSVLESQKS